MDSEKIRFFSGGGVNSADIGALRDRLLLEAQYTTYCTPGGTCLPPRNILNIVVLGPASPPAL
jgi:hypothetical protein